MVVTLNCITLKRSIVPPKRIFAPKSFHHRNHNRVVKCQAAIDDIDWRLGLALAGCSFEAYNDLEETKGPPLKQVSLNGTEVTYLSVQFLKERMAGLAIIMVLNATDLKPSDFWTLSPSSDPYALLCIGDSIGKTSVVNDTVNPVWNETLCLFIRNLKSQKLVVKVLDEDLRNDDLLGTGMRGLADLMDNEGPEEVTTIPLIGSNSTGNIRVSISFTPFSAALAEDVIATMGGPVVGSPTVIKSPWRDLQQAIFTAEAFADALFDPVAFVENPESDTQCYIFWNLAAQRICVAFRGTEQTKLKDLFTDLSLSPAEMNPERLSGSQIEPLGCINAFRNALMDAKGRSGAFLDVLQNKEQSQEIWVHGGFLAAYDSVSLQVIHLLETLIGEEGRRWTVHFTGHSLGGALATLCAYDCAQRKWTGGKPEFNLVNFGSPRVGNRKFSEHFDELVPQAWRVANENDAVVSVPRFFGYCHVGSLVQLKADGEIILVNESKEALGEGVQAVDMAVSTLQSVPEIVKKMFSDEGGDLSAGIGDLEDPNAVVQLLQNEIEDMKSLLEGTAVAEHLEPVYLENLKALLHRLFVAKI